MAAAAPPPPPSTSPSATQQPASSAAPPLPKPGEPGGAVVLDPDALEEQGPQLTFFQQPWVQNVLPFLTSLALHAGIVITVAIVLLGVQTYSQFKPKEEQLVIPEAGMANEMVGGVENPGIDGDPTRPAAQDKYEENTQPDGWAPEAGESPIAEATGGGEGDASANLIGAGAGSFGRGAGFGSGDGDNSGSGTGSGKGPLAPFGNPGGGIPGPRGKVFGNGGTARTIAFCCDSSGSMIDKFSSLKQELAKAIEGLRPIQQFSVVFFADSKAHTFENGSLVNATPENKRKANKWLDELTTSGTSDPIPGLEIAFKGKPELMYILTDGDFPNNNDVLNKVAQLNGGKRTRINTIAFSSAETDEQSESFIKFLNTLADQNGGKFKAVSQDQLD